ncbi:ABC transporter ATP-binding protein [Actinomycetaceae bacterium L2_0104]
MSSPADDVAAEARYGVPSGLALSDVRVRYGPRTILDGLTLNLGAGKVHGLIGPNGAGKSTLAKAVLGLVPYEGTVTVSGHDTKMMNPRRRARHLSYLAQDASMPSDLTGRQLVEMGRYARSSRFGTPTEDDEAAVDAALALTGAFRWDSRPVAQTSGGEQQLTSLARALAQDAPTLILDEPVSALDMAHEMTVLRLMHPWVDQQGDKRLVVVVLHDLSLAARFCDELVLLNPSPSGAVVAAQGSPEEVLTPSLLSLAYGMDVDVRISPVTNTLTVTPL